MGNYFNFRDYELSIPLFVLIGFSLIVMLADAFTFKQGKKNATSPHRDFLAWIAAAGLILSSILALPGIEKTPIAVEMGYNKALSFGGIAGIVHIFLCLSALITLFFVGDYFKRHKKDLSDIYTLLLFAVIGMILLANANDLIILFIGLEIMSICLYIMAAMFKTEQGSNEAGLKYFLLGAFATGFLLYGISILYGLTASTKLDVIAQQVFILRSESGTSILYFVAFALILVGFLFKVAAFPFHSWTPDVYTGAPTPLAGFMATGSKMAAFIAFALFFSNLMPNKEGKIITIVGLLALASMLYGNIVAVQQTNIKRILAYSSIAHTGYLLLGMCAGKDGYQAVMFYMFIYTIMTVGAFGVISILESKNEDTELENWRGLGLRHPWLGAAMCVFLFSLAGMPPLAGFMGKYYVFIAAIRANMTLLATLGILTSVIGAYYYIKIIVVMYFDKAVEGAEAKEVRVLSTNFVPVAGAIVLGLLIIYFGMFPSSITNMLDKFYGVVGTMAGR